MTDKNAPAFSLDEGNLTAREYAAIHLKVPESGTPWLDEMIEKSRRSELVNYLLNPLLNKSDDIYVSPDETFGDALMSLISSYVNGISAASKGDK